MVEVTNSWDILCNICILILENLAHMTGLSYGFINIVLFVILEPLAILSFMFSAVMSFINTKHNVLKVLAKILFAIGTVIILVIMISIIMATLSLDEL